MFRGGAAAEEVEEEVVVVVRGCFITVLLTLLP